MTISTNVIITILVHPYAHKHFVKDFQKTYKQNRDLTRKSIELMIYSLDHFLQTSKITSISKTSEGELLKGEFKIVGSKESAKTAGNRMILYHEYTSSTCHVLLVYHKGHIQGNNETTWWKKEVMDNCEVVGEII